VACTALSVVLQRCGFRYITEKTLSESDLDHHSIQLMNGLMETQLEWSTLMALSW